MTCVLNKATNAAWLSASRANRYPRNTGLTARSLQQQLIIQHHRVPIHSATHRAPLLELLCCPLQHTTSNMITASSESIADMRERLVRLKDVERYTCSDYAAVSSLPIFAHDGASASRLKSIMAARDETLRAIFDVNIMGGAADAAVVSHSAFLFDRYLSTWVPSCVSGANMPHRMSRIGAAAVFIAAKSRVDGQRVWELTEGYAERNRKSSKVFDAELQILMKLNWNINYVTPIDIIDDLLELLPRSTGYQEHDDALVAFKEDILDVSSHLTKLAAITYGFVTKYLPSTIALAVLLLVLENNRPPSSIAVFNLAGSAAEYFGIMFDEACELPLSFEEEGVQECREMLLRVLEGDNSTKDTAITKSSGTATRSAQIAGMQQGAAHSVTP